MIRRIFKNIAAVFILALLVLGGLFFFLSHEAATAHGSRAEADTFTVEKGEGVLALGARLKEEGFIANKWAFALSAVRSGEYRKLQAGNYSFSGEETINEIIDSIAAGKVLPPGVRITFPEGWTLHEMADRLNANHLPGDDFLAIVSDPFPKWREQYPFLSDLPAGQSLEGYLFPDTYVFPPEATGELIVGTLLKNFSKKVTPDMIAAGEKENLNLHALLSLSSIVEAEVNTESDRKMVADIFLRRLAAGQALQSDATLAYILGTDKVKYSVAETKSASPYNTYTHAGLPPGPINNPSLQAIEAVLEPTPNSYFYFLNNADTGTTVFSATFDEHVANKAKNGL